jgi:prepilin-type N-terminal cleavage/methylation domain-containing protein
MTILGVPLTFRSRHPGSIRRGMTLIELLVVVMILGMLSLTVLPTLSGTLGQRRFRDAAGNLSTFIARAQTRALNAKEPRGFIMQPLDSAANAAIDLFLADTPDAYAGEWSTSRVRITYPAAADNDYSWGVLSFLDSETQARIASNFCVSGDSIQFGGSGPYFRFMQPEPGDTEYTVGMWDSAVASRLPTSRSQSQLNTVLPRTGSGGMPFRIRRQPTRASSGVLQLQQSTAVDLRWSSVNGQLFSDFRTGNTPVTVLYDMAGRPEQIVHSNGQRLLVRSPLYLLVGLSELCGNDPVSLGAGDASADFDERTGANWQYVDSVWVCIDHKTGYVRTATVNAKAANASNGSLHERVWLSQAAIRATVSD